MALALPLLTIDRGNSTLDCALHGAAEPRRVRLAPEDLPGLAGFLTGSRPATAVGLSTVPGGLDGVRRLLDELGTRLLEAGRDLPCPLPTAYADAAALGVDRWVAAMAAHRLHRAGLFVDCGTALTVNAIGAGGDFLGGAIAPGLRTMAAGLQARAPALPLADPSRPLRLPATDPSGAVDAGVTLGFCGAVERLVAEVQAAAGVAGAPRLLTGGDAEVYLRHGRLAFQHVPDLVHQGLRCLAETRAPAS